MAGVRFNKGKLRYGLISPFVHKLRAMVFTLGTAKYDDRNWEKGLKVTELIDSAERHLEAFKGGEDIDPDSGLPHTALASWNMDAITFMLKNRPEFDDRPKDFNRPVRIALDIDGVIADFYTAFVEYCKENNIGFDHKPIENQLHWALAYSSNPAWEQIHKDEQAQIDFFVDRVKPLINPEDLNFEPVCYVTSRKIPSEITAKWIEKYNFPCVPVYSTNEQSKVKILKEREINRFVDDAWHNFVELNNSGIVCYLMDSPYNRKYNAGHLRIYKLSDVITGEHLFKQYHERYAHYIQIKEQNQGLTS